MALWEKLGLGDADTEGLWGALGGGGLPELFAQYCMTQHEMGKVECKGAETHLSPPDSTSQSRAGEQALKLAN